ncbi:hypothetical protein [Variovorax sp. LjRoot178]|uniref:hypothetical protein n=1 Tax=Variovorax sp. LjRoot178 TaxID=3342277 RepID=UPI003ED02569
MTSPSSAPARADRPGSTPPAAAKRVAATKVEGPAVDAMRAFFQELLPLLAQAVTGLKDKVIEGRAPAPPRPPANPDQLRMSCGCCQRPDCGHGRRAERLHGPPRVLTARSRLADAWDETEESAT